MELLQMLNERIARVFRITRTRCSTIPLPAIDHAIVIELI